MTIGPGACRFPSRTPLGLSLAATVLFALSIGSIVFSFLFFADRSFPSAALGVCLVGVSALLLRSAIRVPRLGIYLNESSVTISSVWSDTRFPSSLEPRVTFESLGGKMARFPRVKTNDGRDRALLRLSQGQLLMSGRAYDEDIAAVARHQDEHFGWCG